MKVVFENPLLYATPILALVVLLSSRTKKIELKNGPASLSFQLAILGSIYVCVLAAAVVLCLRAGSDINYFFEAGMVASIAALPSAMVLFDWNKRLSGWFFSLASLIVTGVCCVQLAAFIAPSIQGPIPARLAFLRTSDFGRLRLLTKPQEDERRQLAGFIARAPKPILIVDDIFSQPWNSTNNLYPAFSVDPSILNNLKLRGIVKDDRIATLITLRRFRTVVLSEPHYLSLARQDGYHLVSGTPGDWQLLSLNGS
jgi:hypothetical protein